MELWAPRGDPRAPRADPREPEAIGVEASGWEATTLGTGRAGAGAAALPNWDCQGQLGSPATKEMPEKSEIVG